MRAVIDTNIIIDFFNGVEEAQEELSKYDFPIISIITWIEVFVGVRNEDKKTLLHDFFEKFRIDDIDAMIACEAVKIRQTKRIKLPDAIIEATAKANETFLVTQNTKDFDPSFPHIRIPYALN